MFSQNTKRTERKTTFHAGRGIRKHGKSYDRTESHLSTEEGGIFMVSEEIFFLLRRGPHTEPEKSLRLYTKLCTHEHMHIISQG